MDSGYHLAYRKYTKLKFQWCSKPIGAQHLVISEIHYLQNHLVTQIYKLHSFIPKYQRTHTFTIGPPILYLLTTQQIGYMQ